MDVEEAFPIRGRFAPSPSGTLHMGNLRTALLSWLFIRCSGGRYILRIEDLDRPRVRPGSTDTILEDLRWLGLDWDEGPDIGGEYAPYTQSERLSIYEHYLKQLQDRGLIYPCYCTRAEVAQAASITQQDEHSERRYPGTCRSLSTRQQKQYEAQGRRPALRFRVDDERVVHFHDLLRGLQQQQVQQSIGDFIVKRADGIFAYQFAVVVDDGLMRINQVVRGDDLLSSTARQILLFETLGFPVPAFAHMPLLRDEQGQRMAKRTNSSGLTPYKEAGITPEIVVGKLAASCNLLATDQAISPSALASRYTHLTELLLPLTTTDH
jgi:glutamyl-tRNA synthetase